MTPTIHLLLVPSLAFNVHTFKDTNVGWPRCKNGTTSYPKEGVGSCCGGGRPVGRPRYRWEDVIQRGAANLLRIRNWKAAARDKEEWRKKFGEAMALKRAEAPQKKFRGLECMEQYLRVSYTPSCCGAKEPEERYFYDYHYY
jgi:hypothetical protein